MSLTGTKRMRMTTIQTSVQTYRETFGHSKPLIPAVVAISSHGITVYPGRTPAHDFQPDGDRTPDVHFERRADAWAISISPDSAEISVFVTVFDDGTVTVKAADGRLINTEKSDETRPLV